MFKKGLILTFAFMIIQMMMVPLSFASYEGRRDDLNGFQRSMTVMKRGVLNLAGSPAELYSTAVREKEMHPKMWPVTVVPRAITNLVFRGASIVNDTFISPIFVAPFSTDISPMTEPMGLPDYPWEVD